MPTTVATDLRTKLIFSWIFVLNCRRLEYYMHGINRLKANVRCSLALDFHFDCCRNWNNEIAKFDCNYCPWLFHQLYWLGHVDIQLMIIVFIWQHSGNWLERKCGPHPWLLNLWNNIVALTAVLLFRTHKTTRTRTKHIDRTEIFPSKFCRLFALPQQIEKCAPQK